MSEHRRESLVVFLLFFLTFTTYIKPPLALAAPSQEQSSYDYFLSGSKKYTELDNDGALADLEKAVALNPNMNSALGLMVIVLAEQSVYYYQAEKYEEAVLYLNKLLKYVPDDKEINEIYNKAKSRIEKVSGSEKAIVSALDRQKQEFVEIWRNYLRIKSQGYSLRDRLAFLKKISSGFSGTQVELGVVEAEIASLEREIDSTEQEKDFNVRFNLGLRKYKSGQYSESLAIWEALFRNYPDHPTLKEYILQAKKEMSDRLAYLSKQADVEFSKLNWLEAIRSWELMLELDPENLDAKSKSADVKNALRSDYDAALNFYKQGLYTKAIEIWQDILKKYPNYPGANSAIAKASNEIFSAGKSAKMDLIDRYMAQAEKLISSKEYIRGVETLKKIVEIDPQNRQADEKIKATFESISREALEFFTNGRYFQAHELWAALVKMNPGDKKAKEMLDLCMRNLEENQNKYFRQGENAFNAGDYASALDNFKKVLKAAPDNKKAIELIAETYLAQGIVYYRTDKLDEAVEQWNNVLKFSPQNEKAKAYKERALTKKETLKKLIKE